jgi:pyoverdine/dityrosine biosynthesis protein Dit1
MSLTLRAYEIVQDSFISNEEFVMLRIADAWPKEYSKAVETMLEEDANADADGIPNLSMVCEAVASKDEKRFLGDLVRFVQELDE